MALQYPIEVTGYMERSYAPLEQRMEGMARLLEGVPGYLESVRALIEPPLATPVLDTNIESYQGIAAFYAEDLAQFLRQHPMGALDREVEGARAAALAAVNGFVEFLTGLRDTATPEFAIGDALYASMLRHGELLDLPLSQVEAVGEADLRRNRDRLREAAGRVAPGAPINEAMALLGQDHPSADRLVAETREVLEDLRAFVVDHGVASVVSEVRASVKETPPFMRWAFAAMDSAGPSERVATEFILLHHPRGAALVSPAGRGVAPQLQLPFAARHRHPRGIPRPLRPRAPGASGAVRRGQGVRRLLLRGGVGPLLRRDDAGGGLRGRRP